GRPILGYAGCRADGRLGARRHRDLPRTFVPRSARGTVPRLAQRVVRPPAPSFSPPRPPRACWCAFSLRYGRQSGNRTPASPKNPPTESEITRYDRRRRKTVDASKARRNRPLWNGLRLPEIRGWRRGWDSNPRYGVNRIT